MHTIHLWFTVGAIIFSTGCDKNNGGNPPPPAQTPRITVSDISLNEGASNTSFEFELRLSNPASKPVTVSFSTEDGTAKAGADYTVVQNGQVSFQPAETIKKFSVAVAGDDIKEGDETFKVFLSNASNATISTAAATALIKNDDTKVPFTNAGYDAPATYPGYSLVWSDEFNGTSLNGDAWTHEIGDGCPNCGWGNNELQAYTDNPGNLFFQDGKLIIEAKKERYSGKEYTSARIKTQGKKRFKFGRIDVRAKLPIGKGIWPALWLMPQDNVYGGWPTSGELDMMEYIGSEATKVFGTVHFGPGPGSIYITKSTNLASGNFNDEFHVFSLVWKQDEISWLVDGNVYATTTKAEMGNNIYPFNEDFYFIINMAVGGNLPGAPEPSTYFPQWYIVDYIRYYQ